MNFQRSSQSTKYDPTCNYLASTNICGQNFQNLPVIVSEAEFISKINSIKDPDLSTERFTQPPFNCMKSYANTSSSHLQYQLVLQCSVLVTEGIANCDIQGLPKFQICQNQCDISVSNLSHYLLNPSCNLESGASDIISNLVLYCQMHATGVPCANAVDLEGVYNGFVSFSALAAYCDEHVFQPECRMALSEHKTDFVTSMSNSFSNTSLEGRSIVYAIASVFGVIVVGVVIAGIRYYKRRRTEESYTPSLEWSEKEQSVRSWMVVKPRQESSNDDELDKASSGDVKKSVRFELSSCFVVRMGYVGQRDDEMSVEVGMRVRVIKEFADGWVLCKDASDAVGMIPKQVLDVNSQ